MTTMRVPPASVYFPPEDRAAILQQIDECLPTGQLTLGKLGRQLEERFAAYVGADHAVAVNSGTSAIEIPLRAIGVEGKEVLVPANTFFATAAAAVAAGASIRFVDCDPAHDGHRSRRAARPPSAPTPPASSSCTSAVWSARTSANSARSATTTACSSFEDAAHAHGSALDGQMAGTFGVAGSFSFYPTKVMAGRRGRHDRHRRRAHRRRGPDLPRSGQGVVPHQLAHPTRVQLADERAARGHRADPVRPPGRVHRPPPARRGALRRGARRRRRSRRSPSPTRRAATTTSTSPSCPTTSTGPCSSSAPRGVRRRPVGRGLRHAAAPPARVRAVGRRSAARAPRSCAPATSACPCRRS